MKNAILFFTLSFFFTTINAQNKGASPIVQSRESRVVSQNTYAVVVGISDYQEKEIPDLRYADKDAEAFANFLRSPAGGSLDGDHLKLLTNQKATAGRIAEALDGLIEQAKEGDQVIIYFSGHGDVEGKKISQPGFLLCWDSPSRVYMGGGTYSLAFLQEVVTTLSVQNKTKVTVITDACHAGKLAGSQIGGAQLTSANLAKQYANEVKILSCQPNEFSLEGQQWGGGRGAFSYHLVEGLFGLADKNSDGIVTVGEMDRYLEDHVTTEASPQSQVPMLLGNKTDMLAKVNASVLAELKKNKTGNMTVFAATESRGLEEEVLAKVDSSFRKMYHAFKLAINEKRFFTPTGHSAEDYYSQLSAVEKLAPLRGIMKRNYAAALQDDAQQTLNEWMKTSDDQLLEATAGGRQGRLPKKVFTEKVRSFPRLLDRAAGLLGRDHYMYAILQARKYFFEGYLLANSSRNPNRELGEKALAIFRQSLDWQAVLPQTYWQMSKVYGWILPQPDSAEACTRKAMELNPGWVLPYTDLAFIFSEKYQQFDRAKPWLEQAMRLDSNLANVRNSWGVYFSNKKEFSKAEQQYKITIQLDSTYVNAYNNLGADYILTHRYAEAEQLYKKAIQLDSTATSIYSNLANVYSSTRRYAEAEQLYKKAIQLDSTDVNAYNNLGNVYRETRRYAEAEQLSKKAIQLDSTFTAAYNNLANVYRESRRYAEAEQLSKKAIQLDSTLTEAYNNLGNVYQGTRHYAEAEQLFKKVIQLDSTISIAYNNLGNVYQRTRRYAEAEQLLKKAIQLDSTLTAAYSNLGNVYLETRRYAEAEQLFKKAIQLDSTISLVYSNLGNVYNDTRRYAEAEQLYKKAIQLDSINDNAYINLGNVYLNTRRYAEAEQLYKKAIQLDSTSNNGYINLGLLYAVIGRYAEAEQLCKKAMQLDSTNVNFYNILVELYGRTSRYAEAEQLCKKAIQLDSTSIGAYNNLGTVYLETRRYIEAEQLYKKAIQLDSTYPKVYYNLAHLQILQNRKDEAFDYLEKALKNGYNDLDHMQKDSDLAPLREQKKKWNALMKKYFPNKMK